MRRAVELCSIPHPFHPSEQKALAGGPGCAKCAKGRAPRVVVAWAKNGRVQVPIQRFFATLRMTTFVYAQNDGFY